ncbi:type VI secretion system-associated protein TagF [Pantoea phytobeneficialis]|uniref:Type VI secretion system-associated protein TagF n=1 Tax=Pantoea phytobeneficialis TaxID=2052056 RepID=A0AAP9H984_9GAMM|nr:type VI secretion system-associated protein TagF [Pantoea phytobeneficialis]MDO6408596.1 type VI secretion system-associated protein TagF [Pantoea phytobeneficialis]QGR08777.1 type VI secretion system-associated protein TagF [Pantoea phytobeneficialis]
MATHTAPGWYGKLPTTGDFLRQRLSENSVTSWSHWFQQGLLHWHQQENATTQHFLAAPVWNFVLPISPLRPQVQMGCLLPSCDRVGRAWPLLALRSFPVSQWHPAQLALSGDWYQELGMTLLRAVRDAQTADMLELAIQQMSPLLVPEKRRTDIMDVIGFADLPSSLSWREVADHFDPHEHISYWWSNRSDGFAHATHKHSGPLTAQLFALLFNPASGAQPGRNGLYPPMFE